MCETPEPLLLFFERPIRPPPSSGTMLQNPGQPAPLPGLDRKPIAFKFGNSGIYE